MEKKVYDMRGNQANIARLLGFYKSAFVHMLFYRLLIFLGIIYGIVLIASVFYSPLILAAKAFTIIIWILFMPQVFAAVKVLSLTRTRGLSFGHLGEEYTFLAKKRYKGSTALYTALPYIVLAIWIVGIAFAAIGWNV